MEKIRICFTSSELNAYSETFIHNLKNGLDAEIFHCYGIMFPYMSEDKKLQNYKTPPLIDIIKNRVGIINRSLKEHYLVEYIKTNKISLIFSNYGPSGAELVSISKDLNLPLIVHFHGFDASIYEVLYKYRNAYLEMFSVAKAIIVVSEEMKNDLIALGAPKEKIFKIIYSPNPIFSDVTPNYQSNQILAIGRFVEKKAPHLTLLAFKMAKTVCPDLELKFVGTGELLSVCQDLCDVLKIGDVTFTGKLAPEEIAYEMGRSFCFVQHSRKAINGDKEGTPVSVLESLAAGLPVVSTYHAGIPEVVTNNIHGFLVTEGDVEGMAEKITILAKDRFLASNFGFKAKKKIKEDFSYSTYINLLNKLVKDSVK